VFDESSIASGTSLLCFLAKALNAGGYIISRPPRSFCRTHRADLSDGS